MRLASQQPAKPSQAKPSQAKPTNQASHRGTCFSALHSSFSSSSSSLYLISSSLATPLLLAFTHVCQRKGRFTMMYVCMRSRVRACVRSRDSTSLPRVGKICVYACVVCARIRFSRETVLDRKTSGAGEGGWNENKRMKRGRRQGGLRWNILVGTTHRPRSLLFRKMSRRITVR